MSTVVTPVTPLCHRSNNLTRDQGTFSLLITLEHTNHSDFTEIRAQTELIVRF